MQASSTRNGNQLPFMIVEHSATKVNNLAVGNKNRASMDALNRFQSFPLLFYKHKLQRQQRTIRHRENTGN